MSEKAYNIRISYIKNMQ